MQVRAGRRPYGNHRGWVADPDVARLIALIVEIAGIDLSPTALEPFAVYAPAD